LWFATACADASAEREPGVVVVAQETQAAWIRNFNPLLPPGTARWPTRAGIYEPLAVFNTLTGEYVPWLGTSWAWSPDALTLTVKTRSGVSWSDGQPFSAADVAFTFGLMDRNSALDPQGVWGWLASVEAPDTDTVVFHLSRPFVPGLDDVLAQPIVPEHVWKDVADPLAFANPDPVGTGPFTEVRVFQNQVFELGRNPHYWQPGKPAVGALRFPAFAGNDQANLALAGGEVDWAGNFVPAADRTFVAADPANRAFWSPPVESTVFLYANTQRAPFADARVRRALSMAIDRERLVEVAMVGTTHPADATGLSDAYERFRDPTAAAADWVHHDPEKARELLDEAGLVRGPDGVRTGPDGKPLHFAISVVAGWSDWIRAAGVIARDLAEVGVTATVTPCDFNSWFDGLERGSFDLAIGWSSLGPTPYLFYRDLMGTGSLRPLGEAAPGNWHRYASPRADALLTQLETTTDDATSDRLIRQLEGVFAEEAPAIPLFPGPAWGASNSRYVEGFPSTDHPWALLSPNRAPGDLLVMTALEPNDGAGAAMTAPEPK
jgi:peptide/nickel transport system substrate-binding protein